MHDHDLAVALEGLKRDLLNLIDRVDEHHKTLYGNGEDGLKARVLEVWRWMDGCDGCDRKVDALMAWKSQTEKAAEERRSEARQLRVGILLLLLSSLVQICILFYKT